MEQSASEKHAQDVQVGVVPSSAIMTERLPDAGSKEEHNFDVLLQHIEEFVSQDCDKFVKDIPVLATAIDAGKCVKVATELKENIAGLSHSTEIESPEFSPLQTLNEHNAVLTLELQHTLSIMQPVISENVEELALENKDVDTQHVNSVITGCTSNLKALNFSVIVMEQLSCDKHTEDVPVKFVPLSEMIVESLPGCIGEEDYNFDSESRDNSLQRLNCLLQEVCDKIDISIPVKTIDDFEIIHTILDEMQTVIIKLKRDYDRSLNDILSEALEDLECAVRSVQLQINENSPTELLKEACASLKILMNNMCEIQVLQVFQTTPQELKLENIIYKCALDSEETLNLLDLVLNTKIIDQNDFDTLFSDVSVLKIIIKSLKLHFEESAEVLIEKGIEIMQSLDLVEDRVFALEKNIDKIKNVSPTQKDSIVTTVHTVYGTISNMRSAMASVQKQYMFQNYGKYSALILKAIKNVFLVANECDKSWKKLAKCLRKVLNNFEDIKFYVNFDKTARLPSDATFLKIILFDLKTVIEELFSDNESQFCEDIIASFKAITECLDFSLRKIESHSSLEVKDKIPIFKTISQQIYAFTKSINEHFINSEINLNDVNRKISLPIVNNQNDFQNVKHSQNEFSENCSNFIQNESENIENDVDITGKTEDSEKKFESCMPNFDLEIIPETIMTINVPEISVLKLINSKPFESIVLQSIDTGILFEAKVTEAVKGKLDDNNENQNSPQTLLTTDYDLGVDQQCYLLNKKKETQVNFEVKDALNNLEQLDKKEENAQIFANKEKIESDNDCQNAYSLQTINNNKTKSTENSKHVHAEYIENEDALFVQNYEKPENLSISTERQSIENRKLNTSHNVVNQENNNKESKIDSQNIVGIYDDEENKIDLSKQYNHEINIEAETSLVPNVEHLLDKKGDNKTNTKNIGDVLNDDNENLRQHGNAKSYSNNNDKNMKEKPSSEEVMNVKKIETYENNNLNDNDQASLTELYNLAKGILSVSEIKPIEMKTGDRNSSNNCLQPNDCVESLSKKRALFSEKTKSGYDNEFLKPPGYIGKTYNNDRPILEIDRVQNCSFYKTQTLVSNTQYQPSISPERHSDGHVKKIACNEERNLSTEKRSNVFRDFKRKPVFSTHLTDRTAVEGSRVKLTCSILTSTEPKIFWYKNGVLLNNKLKYKIKVLDGLLTMEVLNAVPTDTAEYSCTVETENGTISTAANLKVYPSFEASPIPPTFTRSIRDNYHLAENELVLECRIRGQPLPTITWLKDDRSIEFNERYQAYYLADGVCRLSISNPTIEDSGKFTCHAESSVWSDQISHVVTFTGKNIPNLTSTERSQLNRQLLETRRLHFTNVLSDYKVAKGGTIGLQVEIKGSPTRVEWLREGHSVTDIYKNAQTFVDHSLYTLALSDVTEKESGIYTFRAWSNHGKVDMNAAITVIQPNEIDGKPAIIIGRPQKDMLISVGEDLNISFRVRGEPKPKVAFMKGIRDITNSQRVCKMTSDDYMKFTLKRSVVSDAGTYCILARNAYGCDRAFVTVMIRQRASSENLISDWTYPIDDSVIAIPERKYKSVPNRIPGEPSVVDGGNHWISLAWSKADSESGAPVLAYKVESWLLGKDGGARWIELGITPLNNFDAFNLKQGEEYHFRVTPRNRYGWGESVQTSTPIGIGLAGDRPEFIDILPGQLKVLVGGTATLNCSFKGKPTPEIVWMKNGHEIDEEDKRLQTSLSENNCCLIINNVRIEDEARYSCEATNLHGRASTYARVAVVTDRLIWEADAKLKRERSADVGGECPPQFTMRLRDRRVQATYPVRLTCQVIGRPSPIVTWYKSGVEILDENRHTKSQDELFHTLEIAPTKLEDGGVYEATARNNSGAISCRCNLVVDKGIRAYVAPEFCCGLQPLYQLTIGDELRISAVVEAYPSVGVTWYRDGVRLRPSRRAVMTLDHDGQIELAVASVTQRDAGVYTCTASNEVGKSSTSGKVEVLGDSAEERKQMLPTLICPDVPYSKEPTFIRKPRSSEAREGDIVIIECEVIGDPKPEVYWLRDFLKPDYYRDASHFRRIGDGPEYRFEIPHAKLDYTGAYSVVARNVYGEVKAVISLQILAKDPFSPDDSHSVRYGRVEVIPRFEKELTDLLSHDGDAVEFQCQVTGNPEPDIKWYRYSEIIRESEEFGTSFEHGEARLKIKQVTADDEGTYTCEARNSLGKAVSSACLVVYPAGEPNTLSQRLRRPPALLSANSTPRSTPARSLSRTRTPGPDMRSLCSPTREIAPKFYTYPFNKVAEEGDTVVFQCAVKGLPAPWATWDKDGVVITPTSRITIKEKDELLRILEIEEVSREDVGLYRITLENDYGRVEASARLEVISQKGKFYTGGRSYSASPKKSLPYRRSMFSLPRQD